MDDLVDVIHHEGSIHGRGVGDMVKGLGVRRNGGFIGGKGSAKVGDGCVAKMDGGWGAKGEGSAKVAKKGFDEG